MEKYKKKNKLEKKHIFCVVKPNILCNQVPNNHKKIS